MKWGIIADIHANKYALKAVLDELQTRGMERLAVLGDIVGGGPHPEEVIQMLKERAKVCVIGDHDLHVLGRTSREEPSVELKDNFHKTHTTLSKDSLDWLGKRARVSYWREHLFVHATPFNCFYGDIKKASATMVEKVAYGQAFCGHTHKPMTIRNNKDIGGKGTIQLKSKDIVVVGSVGWPYGATPVASAAIWDSKNNTLEFLQVSYDVETFKQDAFAYGYNKFTKTDW